MNLPAAKGLRGRIGATLLLAAIASLLISLPAGAALAPGFSAEVLDVQGVGQQRSATATDWLPAAIHQGLPGGAFVRTLAASRMALLFADQTQVRLNQNSMLQVKAVASEDGGRTVLRLEIGRAWAQTKNAPTSLQLETPAATAAIRGTDWELEVERDGTTTLVVLSGSVEYFNALGRITVDRNEAAIAEVGKAPVKILLTRPRDRILWVNAYRFEPQRFTDASNQSPTVRLALAAVDRGDLAAAMTLLRDARNGGSRDVATYAMLAELEIVAGDFDTATAVAKDALRIAPDDPDLQALLVRAQLLADQVDDAKATLALPRRAETAGILVAEGETARREGRAPEALAAFERATRAAPGDDRGWFALGRAQAEREDSVPARRNLRRALELNPDGAGYEGERGTLETFANHFAEAEAAFAAALRANPGDYVALTGLGLLRLKTGDPAAALDALLRAGVMEPRYARAKTYTGVAYYQLGRHADAIETLRQAAALDDLDPLPYIFLSQIHTDLFHAGEAVQAARDAKVRLPNLKSLNQIANNLRGTADVGYALSFFGLEDWALELAQQAYNPFSASSHLFLADRYRGEFNKNSELYQGFLTDPTAFGGSNRFATLVPTTGHYRTLGYTFSFGDDRLSNPYLRLNGLFDWPTRTAYYLDAESGVGTIKTTGVSQAGFEGDVKGDERAELYAAGVGSLLTDRLAVFAYGTKFHDSITLRDYTGTNASQNQSRVDVGASYRFAPSSMTWLKLGRTNETIAYNNYLVINADASVADAANSSFHNRPADAELRHTVDLTAADHLVLGYEAANDTRAGTLLQVRVVSTPAGYVGFGSLLDQQAKLRSQQAYVSYVKDLSPILSAQADLFWQEFRQQVDEDLQTIITFGDQKLTNRKLTGGTAKTADWNPRFGAAFRPDVYVVRAAWQRWTQPASVSTLAPVATSGIPLDDRLVAAGGMATRTYVELRAEPNSMSSISAYYSDEKIRNLGQLGYRIPVPKVQFLDLLRNPQLLNVATDDLLEATPEFDAGLVKSAGASLNWMLSNTLALAARYVYTQNDATIYIRDDAGQIVSSAENARIPYVPQHLAALGFTWVSPQRIYLSAQAVYRSERYADRLNTPDALLRADWNGAIAAFWETADKRLIVGAGARNLGSRNAAEQYAVDLRLRF